MSFMNGHASKNGCGLKVELDLGPIKVKVKTFLNQFKDISMGFPVKKENVFNLPKS